MVPLELDMLDDELELGGVLDVPLVPVVLVPLAPALLPWCAFFRSQLELLLLALLDGVEAAVLPDVPVVPAIDPEPLAGARHPVTVTVLLLELLDAVCVLELVCAYSPTAQPMTSASDAPHRFRFMRASFISTPDLVCKAATMTKSSKFRENPAALVRAGVAFRS